MKNYPISNIFSIKIKKRKNPFYYYNDINIYNHLFRLTLKLNNTCVGCVKKLNEMKLEDNNGFFGKINKKKIFL